MSVTSGFFNSINGDRKYNAKQMSSIFDGLITDGVYPTYGTKFAISPGTGTNVIIGTGRAWFNNVWILNDAALSVELGESELLMDRYDAVVIDVDHSDEVRNGTIKMIAGEPSEEPSKPEMIHTLEHNQYPIAYILREARSASISADDIEYTVGTNACPIAESLISTISPSSLIAAAPTLRKSIFRGADLGTVLTEEQKNSIANGSFTNIYLGDYWVDPFGFKWRVVDYDYWLGIGDTNGNVVTKHHITVMPMSSTYSCAYGPNTANLPFSASSLRNTSLQGSVKTNNVVPIFGENHLLKRKALLVYYIYQNHYSGSAYYDMELEIPDSIMLFGGLVNGVNSDVQFTDSHGQFSLFKIRPEYITNHIVRPCWIRDGDSSFLGTRSLVCCGGGHVEGRPHTDSTCGLRPIVSIVGD